MGAINLLNLFIGKWKIVLRTKTQPVNDSSATVDISPSAEITVRDNKLAEILRFDDASIDLKDGTLCGSNNDYRIRISFFRQIFYDTVFALLEKKGDPSDVSSWCAQRVLPESDESPPRIDNTRWLIVDTAGQNNATGEIRIDKVSKIIESIGNKSGLFTFKTRIDEIIAVNLGGGNVKPGPHVIESALWNKGFGLSEYKTDKEKWEVYDILAYDQGVKSFNSIFGYRSLEYFHGNGHDSRRVFATFNSELLRMISWFNSNSTAGDFEDALAKEHNFGLMMSFEKSKAVLGDPDIGIWVGSPLAP